MTIRDIDLAFRDMRQARVRPDGGGIRAALGKSGKPLGVSGLHIAAHARSEGLALIGNNLREFERVPGLLMENWVADVA